MPELPPPPRPPEPPSTRLQSWAGEWWRDLPAASRRNMLVGGALAAAVIAAALLFVQAPSRALPELDLPVVGGTAAAPAGPEPIYAHAAGALARPGLYRLPAGSRVADLIEAAGGPTAEADVHQLNLAARLNDGERVHVPRVGEAVPAAEAGAGWQGEGPGKGRLDLNTASQQDLEDLPGVGPATAAAILDERKRRGRFKSVEELLEVRGIGPAKLDQIRDLVKV